MEDNLKHTSSYQLDQEILDERGINMTVQEVAGLSTCKYSERVQSLKLCNEDLAFLKGLRRRIKNRLWVELWQEWQYRKREDLSTRRVLCLAGLKLPQRLMLLASQNSRRRSVEHLRKLARELRAVRACRDDALAERRALITQRDSVRSGCEALRRHILQELQDRSDTTEVPSIEVKRIQNESQKRTTKKITVKETKTPLPDYETIDKNIFECRIDKLVQQSVNHIFKNDSLEKRKVFAKTVFISNEKLTSDIKSMVLEGQDLGILQGDNGVLNLSLKEGRRKSHGRKQLAPRRITCVYNDNDDGVLDLKVNREGK